MTFMKGLLVSGTALVLTSVAVTPAIAQACPILRSQVVAPQPVRVSTPTTSAKQPAYGNGTVIRRQTVVLPASPNW